jgi:hypothetical protein
MKDFRRIFLGSWSKQFTSSIGISLFIKKKTGQKGLHDSISVSLIMGHVKREICRRFRTVIQIFYTRGEHRFFLSTECVTLRDVLLHVSVLAVT